MTRGASSGGLREGGSLWFVFETMSAFDTNDTESVIMTTLALCPPIERQVREVQGRKGSDSRRTGRL